MNNIPILEVHKPKPIHVVAPLVSIIIPTYNHLDLLQSCIESIKKYTDLTLCEIIIVANGCVDDTENYFKTLSFPFRYIISKEPLGYTKATNIGIKAANGDYVILLNNDTILLDQQKNYWIDLLLEPFKLKNSKVGITGPVKFYWKCGETQRNAMAFWCVAIPRILFNELGYLDEIFNPGMGEDGDFSIKAEEAGYSLVQVPNNGSEEFGKGISNQVFPMYHKGSGTFADKDYSDISKRNADILRNRYGVQKGKNVAISIIIPTCGKDWERVLQRCLDGITLFTELEDKEIIVVANGVSKDVINYLSTKQVKVLEFPEKLGYIRAVNIGIKEARGEFVLLIDDDTWLLAQSKNQWIDMLMEPFRLDSQMGATSPFGQTYDDLGPVVHSGCTLYRTTILKQINLFDETFNPGYLGDEDVALRIRKAGYHIAEVPFGGSKKYVDGTFQISFPVVHTGEVHTMPKDTTDLPLVVRNRKILYERHLNKMINPETSIIIPTFNHLEDLLKPCINTLIQYTDLSNTEVIVVANGCTDGTEEWVKSLGTPFKVVSFPDALGFTRATNEGLKIATGEFIILYNNDNILLPDHKDRWRQQLLTPFRDNPLMGVTGPLQLHDDYADADVIIGFCLCIRRSILLECMSDTNGLLDEVFSPGGGEDIDLCCKVRARGYTVRQVPHEGKLGFGHTNEGDFQIWHRSNQTFKDIEEYTRWYVKRNGFINMKRYNNNIRLNLGSGGMEYPGYLSVDLHDRRATIIMDVTNLDLPENSVSELLVLHLFEHLNPYKAIDVLKGWHKVLRPGGKLIMEMPDIEQLCKRFVTATAGERYGILNAVYGSVNTTDTGDPSDITSPHLFGWWPQSISDHLYNAGFTNVTFGPEQYKHPESNMHVSAEKP